MSLHSPSTVQEFNTLEKSGGLVVVHFSAEWAEQCEQMNRVIDELIKQPELKEVTFVRVCAEDLSEVSLRYNIRAVPTCVLVRQGEEVDRVQGANAAALTTAVKKQAAKTSLISISPAGNTVSTGNTDSSDLDARLKRLVCASKCVLFMKGTPDAPRCGFSRTTVDVLNKMAAEYSTFDILKDEEVRQGLKTYSNWPTYPQLYVDGELLGGLDIVKEMEATGELRDILPKKTTLNDRLCVLINRSAIMVFMKGDRINPKCGFSKTLINMMQQTGLVYDTYDILTDEEVRQGLKTYSNWPTYPQVYVKGELVGGLDILKELYTSGELINTLKGQ
ncbi:hypothetical protein Pmani_038041 [Petrolisthes manimaculis]|uniref:Glutaredoxin 3 n=1 Tax=Petrolisthes manimaculis TaxID=1843537 RepID=A0AAE1TMQ4_9EUCA|nr:hypothetical protein Pmani_038041 [Petrolisthes manimaculis]